MIKWLKNAKNWSKITKKMLKNQWKWTEIMKIIVETHEKFYKNVIKSRKKCWKMGKNWSK